MQHGEFKINFIFAMHLPTYLFNQRTNGGRLHLLPDVGKIVLADATLIEDPSDSERDDEGLCTVP